MQTEANLEVLSTAYTAHLRDETGRSESRLTDAAMACGMSYDEPDVSLWAARRVSDWLVSA